MAQPARYKAVHEAHMPPRLIEPMLFTQHAWLWHHTLENVDALMHTSLLDAMLSQPPLCPNEDAWLSRALDVGRLSAVESEATLMNMANFLSFRMIDELNKHLACSDFVQEYRGSCGSRKVRIYFCVRAVFVNILIKRVLNRCRQQSLRWYRGDCIM